MSAVMTSLSIPSLGTKYSFVRAEAGARLLSRSRVSLEDMVKNPNVRKVCKERRGSSNGDEDQMQVTHTTLTSAWEMLGQGYAVW